MQSYSFWTSFSLTDYVLLLENVRQYSNLRSVDMAVHVTAGGDYHVNLQIVGDDKLRAYLALACMKDRQVSDTRDGSTSKVNERFAELLKRAAT